MHVIFLGAAAQMAQPAIGLLAQSPGVTTLTLSDRAGIRLPTVVLANGTAARTCAIDVTDRRALTEALQQADLVVNTTGPYYLLGEAIVLAAIEAGCHYVDICDDWQPTLALLNHDEAAKKRGVSVLLGAGASPGLTNLLAVEAAAKLDRVERLITGWSLADDTDIGAIELSRLAASQSAPAALVHWMQQISGRIQIWDKGRLMAVRPLQKTPLLYPGLGLRQSWSVGHPEAITLPRQFPTLQSSINVMVDVDHTAVVLQGLSWIIDRGWLTPANAAGWIHHLACWIAPRPSTRREKSPSKVRMPALFALAEGLHQGRPTTVATTLTRWPKGGMAEITGIPLGIFASLLAEGQITRQGVITPENCDAGHRVFARLDAIIRENQAPSTAWDDRPLVNVRINTTTT